MTLSKSSLFSCLTFSAVNLNLKLQVEPHKTETELSSIWINRVITLYADLIFDFCEKILWSSINAQIAFKDILRALKNSYRTERFHEFERAYVLRTAIKITKALYAKHGRHLSASEQMMLDGTAPGPKRLQHFESYFHRLQVDEQILLLLRDKFGLPFSEIATAMGYPEGSLKVMRQQAYACLEEWIWEIQ